MKVTFAFLFGVAVATVAAVVAMITIERTSPAPYLVIEHESGFAVELKWDGEQYRLRMIEPKNERTVLE